MSEISASAIKKQGEHSCSSTSGCDSGNMNSKKDNNEEDSDDSETEGADDVNEDSEVDEITHQSLGVFPGDNESKADTLAHDEDIDEDSESLDPRIQEELEKLNCSTDVINKLEVDLEEARHTFRILMRESGQQLERLSKQSGASSVEKARPYYEARMRLRQAHSEAQRAAARFEKASNAHEAAKEMVTLAEEGYKERGCLGFDQAWQEMLNHASSKVNESEAERNASAAEHRAKSMAYSQAEGHVQRLQKSLKKHINKSRPYFELKARFNQILDDQKKQVQVIEETITMTKEGYADSLKELERISEEIHQRRTARQKRRNLGLREQGVGAESTPPNQKKLTGLDVCQLCDHDGDETDGFRLNITQSDDEVSAPSSKPGNQAQKTSLNSQRKLETCKECSRRSTPSANTHNNTSNSTPASPTKSPTYQKSQEPFPHGARHSISGTPVRMVKSGKMDFLTIRKLSDDEFSEADSLASTEQLDDEQIEQLMLESEGFDTLQDAKTLEDSHSTLKSPQKVVTTAKSN